MAGDRCHRDPRSGPGRRGQGKKGGVQAQALGRSRGGFGTKIHAVVDALGLPVRFVLGPGQQNDMAPACDLIRGLSAQQVLADRAYKQRWGIEGFFAKLKQWRRIATRYDKLAANFLGFIKLASIMLWLK